MFQSSASLQTVNTVAKSKSAAMLLQLPDCVQCNVLSRLSLTQMGYSACSCREIATASADKRSWPMLAAQQGAGESSRCSVKKVFLAQKSREMNRALSERSIFQRGSNACVRPSPITDPRRAEFIIFRFRTASFLYSRHLSRPVFSKIASALSRHSPGKKVFAYDAELVDNTFYNEFGWVQTNMVDARELAIDNGIDGSFEGIVNALVGGNVCPRARYHSSTALPSLVATRHLDISVSAIYEFCLTYLHLRGVDLSDCIEDDNQRTRERQNDAQRKKDRRRDGNSDRSRSRHR